MVSTIRLAGILLGVAVVLTVLAGSLWHGCSHNVQRLYEPREKEIYRYSLGIGGAIALWVVTTVTLVVAWILYVTSP